MAETTVLKLTYRQANAAIKVPSRFGRTKFGNAFARFWTGIVNGAMTASCTASPGAVAAAQTLTLSGVPAAAGTVTVGAVTLTAVASGATGAQFNLGASAALTAVAIAAAYNAQAAAAYSVTAEAVGSTVVFTAFYPGKIGNMIACAEALTNATIGGAFLAGGADANFETYSYGA